MAKKRLSRMECLKKEQHVDAFSATRHSTAFSGNQTHPRRPALARMATATGAKHPQFALLDARCQMTGTTQAA